MDFFFSAISFHNNKLLLNLDQCSLILRNSILTLKNLGPRVKHPGPSFSSSNIGKEALIT